MLRVVPDEEFLHTKINNKDVYVDYVADNRKDPRICMQFKALWMEI